MLCSKCHQNEGVEIAYAVKYKPNNKLIGFVRRAYCKSCRRKEAWKEVPIALIKLVVGIAGVLVLYYFFRSVINVAWIGGLFVIGGILKATGGVLIAALGGGNEEHMYRMAYSSDENLIPMKDFFWINPDPETQALLFADGLRKGKEEKTSSENLVYYMLNWVAVSQHAKDATNENLPAPQREFSAAIVQGWEKVHEVSLSEKETNKKDA